MMKSLSIAGMLIAPAAAHRAPSATDNDRLLWDCDGTQIVIRPVDKTCPPLRSALKEMTLRDGSTINMRNRHVYEYVKDKDVKDKDVDIDANLGFNEKVKVKINECKNMSVRLSCTQPGSWIMSKKSEERFKKRCKDYFQPRPEGRVAYITDVEGGLFWFKRCIKDHAFLRIKDVDGHSVLEFTEDAGPNDHFVYGGDVTSNNYHENMRLTKMMLDFKEKEPERVRFVLGNRDLRISPNLMQIGDKPFQTEVTDDKVFKKEVKDAVTPFLVDEDDGVIFQTIEKEAQQKMKKYLLDYIDVAEHVVIINDTAFVHGAILQNVLPKKYLEHNKDICSENLDDETESSSTFKGDTPQQWAEHSKNYPKINQNMRFFGNYGQNVHIDMDGKWNDPCVVKFLQLGGIRRVITGHKPQYDLPSFAQENGFEVLVADTNYAGGRKTKHSRGPTKQQVILEATGKSTDFNGVAVMEYELRVEGTLNEGKKPGQEWKKVFPNYVIDPKDPLVGTIRKHCGERWWVRAKVGEKYLYSRVWDKYTPMQKLVKDTDKECEQDDVKGKASNLMRV